MSTETRKRRNRPKPAAEFMKHTDLAARLSIDPETLRKWVDRGSWPLPHATIEQTLFFRVDLIEHFFATGEWLETARFRPGEGKGRTSPEPRPIPDPD